MISVWGASFVTSLWSFVADAIVFGRRLNKYQNISHNNNNKNNKNILTPDKIKSRFFHLFQRKSLAKKSP